MMDARTLHITNHIQKMEIRSRLWKSGGWRVEHFSISEAHRKKNTNKTTSYPRKSWSIFWQVKINHKGTHTFCDISSEMRQEKLLKTLHINQTCKKYYHIYTPVLAPIPTQPIISRIHFASQYINTRKNTQ